MTPLYSDGISILVTRNPVVTSYVNSEIRDNMRMSSRESEVTYIDCPSAYSCDIQCRVLEQAERCDVGSQTIKRAQHDIPRGFVENNDIRCHNCMAMDIPLVIIQWRRVMCDINTFTKISHFLPTSSTKKSLNIPYCIGKMRRYVYRQMFSRQYAYIRILRT